MKIRNGFVSNSSSSSFIVALKKKPQSVEELKQMFFGNKKYFGDSKTTESIDRIALLLWKQLQQQKPITKKELVTLSLRGYWKGSPVYWPETEYTKYKKLYDQLVKQYPDVDLDKLVRTQSPKYHEILATRRKLEQEFEKKRKKMAIDFANKVWKKYQQYQKFHLNLDDTEVNPEQIFKNIKYISMLNY